MTLVRFDSVRVPRWVAYELRAARRRGWTGVVLSGFRTRGEQLSAAARFSASAGVPVSDMYPYGPLASNHCGTDWPRGAVDVTHPEQLARILRRPRLAWRGRRLVWAIDVGFDDAAHFSRTGR
jgi:hypothetical protein